MSGHSKWATTKRQKAVTDAKRGAIFTKLSNLITVAVREKGGDPETNFSLRMLVNKAREANMPKDNVDRAIKRGTGESGDSQIMELVYEGIGPANSQFVIKSVTDNKNRSASNIRHLFSKCGGALGSVMWNFEHRGVIRIAADNFRATAMTEIELDLIDAGADDIIYEEEGVTIYTGVADLQKVSRILEEKQIAAESVDIEYVAKESLALSGEEGEKITRFIDSLEDCEDVSDYYTNAIVS